MHLNQNPFGMLAMLGAMEILIILAVLGTLVVSLALFIGLVVWLGLRFGRSNSSSIAPFQPGDARGPKGPPEPPFSSAKSPNDAPPIVPCPRCGTMPNMAAPHGVCPKCALAAGFDTQPALSPDINSAAPSPAALAAHFPQLEILTLLGSGGMGWVYQARQPSLDRLVALKVLPPETAARDPAFEERFRREAQTLARLNHPNIVAIHDFGKTGPYFYFVMEFVDGANLRQLEQARRLSPEEAFALVPTICEALQYAHDQGVVHRDIKPENLLIDPRGRLKIADFGIAKIAGPAADITLTRPRQTLGTPHYMAPEQLGSPDTVDHRADIYALGVVFYEMLTGNLPLGRFAPPSKTQRMDTRIDDVVLRSLEPDRDRRYQTAAAVKTDVETITNENRVSGPT